jgi:hypothetical protein
LKHILTTLALLLSLTAYAVVNGVNQTLSTATLVQCNNGTIERNWTSCPTGWSAGPIQLKAFPGAEGFGKNSVGGRGGTVIKVTNLNDSGAGSFRDAVMTSGARTVVFDVSGIINLESQIFVTEPYLTIAGQTSPGGVMVTGYTFYLNTHDVIIRHMRFRVGSHRTASPYNANPETLDSFGIWGDTVPGGSNDAYNIILDHVSIGWGVDESIGISYRAHDITIQRSSISNSLSQAGHPSGEHSKGMLINGEFGGASNVSVYRNFFAHNVDRNPRIGGVEYVWADIVNNVGFNGYHNQAGVVIGENSGANIVHNFLKAGPDTTLGVYEAHYMNPVGSPSAMVYMEGNIGENRTSQSDPEWAISDRWYQTAATTALQRLTPWDTAGFELPITISSVAMADAVVADAGATVPIRDSVDQQNVDDYTAGTGTYTLNVTFPDDFPTFTTPTPPTDSDNDGMADSWEATNGLNVGVNDSATVASGEAYTNIERYINELTGN